jgi:hypothetical protein
MNFEPPKSCDVVEFLRLDQKTFKDRMQVCMANLGGKLTAVDTHIHHFSPKAARVNLATFAAVVSKWGWSIPQQLQALEQHAPKFEAWPLKPEPQPAPAPTKPAITAPVVEVMRHITRDTRRSTLKPVIEHAQSLCKDPWDTAEVWGQLHTLTAQKHTVLLHLEGDAVVYTDGDNTKKLTKKKLGERLVTAKKKLGITV